MIVCIHREVAPVTPRVPTVARPIMSPYMARKLDAGALDVPNLPERPTALGVSQTVRTNGWKKVLKMAAWRI